MNDRNETRAGLQPQKFGVREKLVGTWPRTCAHDPDFRAERLRGPLPCWPTSAPRPPALVRSATVLAVGPLEGLRIVEIAGIGPGPFAAMLLSDMGADIMRVDRPGSRCRKRWRRRRSSTGAGLRWRSISKIPHGVEVVLRLVERADGLIEGFRPGVMERLGLGPDVCLGRNPRLVYGRMTGWGQEGPLGADGRSRHRLHRGVGRARAMAREGEKPLPPLNLVGDFGGGGMFMAFGMMCGVLRGAAIGRGQVIDAAMVDGASLMMSMFWGMRGIGAW